MYALQEQVIAAPAEQAQQLPATPSQAIGDLMLNDRLLEQSMKIAESMASAKVTVPKHLQGNVGDCYAITLQALQWRMNPFVVAQKTHVVNGTLGYEAQLVNAVVAASGAIRGSFSYEYRGDGNSLECRVGAVLRGTEAITWGEWLKSSDVTTKNSPLWKVNPKQQLGYLQVKNWARLYCPGAILGVYSTDELQDYAPPRDITPARVEPAELPEYPAERFELNLPKWRAAIEGGHNTADDVIATLTTRFTLTDEQRDTILAIKVADATPEPAEQEQQQ